MLGRALARVEASPVLRRAGATEEFVLSDLHDALEALQSVTGHRASDAVLTEIFARFCVGK